MMRSKFQFLKIASLAMVFALTTLSASALRVAAAPGDDGQLAMFTTQQIENLARISKWPMVQNECCLLLYAALSRHQVSYPSRSRSFSLSAQLSFTLTQSSR